MVCHVVVLCILDLTHNFYVLLIEYFAFVEHDFCLALVERLNCRHCRSLIAGQPYWPCIVYNPLGRMTIVIC